MVLTCSGTFPHPRGENGGGRVGTSSQKLPRWLTHWICVAKVPVWSPASSVSRISFYSFGTHKLKGDKGVWGDFRIGASSPHFLSAIPQLEKLLPFYQAPYDATRVTSMKTSLKNRLRILSNHFVIILGCPVT